MAPEVSVVVPVCNEELLLEQNLKELIASLEGLEKSFEVVVVENGSTDNTLEVAKRLASGDKRVRVLSLPKKSLGNALKKGFLEARGEFLVWYPIDLSVDFSYIKSSLEGIEGFDLVVGSKHHPDSKVERPLLRKLCSKLFNLTANALFGLGLSDTQCVKTLRRASSLRAIEKSESGDLVFEVELLHRAKRMGLRIREIPVIVRDLRKESKVDPWLMVKTPLQLLLLRFRLR